MKSTTKKLTYGALIVACAIVLPQLFHLSGIPNTGAVFLPMHIPVLLGGFILGPAFGAVIGALSPLISSLLTAMPPLARLPFMVTELAGYGFFAGLMYQTLGFNRKKCGTYLSLVCAMLFGRVLYTLAAFVASACGIPQIARPVDFRTAGRSFMRFGVESGAGAGAGRGTVRGSFCFGIF